MQDKKQTGWRRFRHSGAVIRTALQCWIRHESNSLQGHYRALLERLSLARRAQSVGELIDAQVDLLPESRRRMQRNRDTRRAIWLELVNALRQTSRRVEQRT